MMRDRHAEPDPVDGAGISRSGLSTSWWSAFFAAYVAGRALPPGVDYLRVFQFVGATAFIGYTMALWQMSIWYAARGA